MIFTNGLLVDVAVVKLLEENIVYKGWRVVVNFLQINILPKKNYHTNRSFIRI